MLGGDARKPRHLPRLAHKLAIVAALDEESLGMRPPEERRADLLGGDVGGDREHRRARPMGVVESLDQVRVPRPAAAGADGERSRELCFGRGGKGGGLLVPDVDLDPAGSAGRIHKGSNSTSCARFATSLTECTLTSRPPSRA
jgi:hypothetical protein